MEHQRHTQPILFKLFELYGKAPMPPGGVSCIVHARYDTSQSPPDMVRVPGSQHGEEPGMHRSELPWEFHLFNWTGQDTTGYPYDCLYMD